MNKLAIHNGFDDFWEINGATFRTPYNTTCNIKEIHTYIDDLVYALEHDLYLEDHTILPLVFSRFSGADYIIVSFAVCKEHFLRMFEYYCIQFIESRKTLTTTDHNKVVPLYQVVQLMLSCDDGHLSCWPINRAINKLQCRGQLAAIANGAYDHFWLAKIKNAVQHQKDLLDISKQITATRTIEFLGRLDKELLYIYLTEQAARFTREREVIHYIILLKRIVYFQKQRSLSHYNPQLVAVLTEVVDKQRSIQRNIFCRDNQLQMRADSNNWIFYNLQGPSLRKVTFDFTSIRCSGMALELKYYLMWKLDGRGFISQSFFSSCVTALNALAKVNPTIGYFSDVTQADVRALVLFLETQKAGRADERLSQYSIAKAIRSCKSVADYLIGDMRDGRLKTPTPYHNPFSAYAFHHLREYNHGTEAIPEDVIEQLDMYIDELAPLHQLLYNIFRNTGLRLKELYFLEFDCIETSKFDNLSQLKFKPHKTLAARKRANVEEYHRVLISNSLADEISHQIRASANLRDKHDLPYIFLHSSKNQPVAIMNSLPFVQAIRSLIDQHNICDENGDPWRFTIRQFRKTVAVTLIENGATTEELAYWLGHLSSDTAAKYYAEVRKAKLAAMNTEFFKNKFELILSKEQLETYSEEERRLLYMDFRLGQRKIELGFCLRKLADGQCGHRNSVYNCVNCKNLCTGKKYLSYWQELLTSQEGIVSELLRIYRDNQIYDYLDYTEYQQESNLLEGYKNIVNAILEGGGRI